jgi:predicted phage tail protein
VLEKIAPICTVAGVAVIAATAQLSVPLAAVVVGPAVAIVGGAATGIALLLVPRRKTRKRRAA